MFLVATVNGDLAGYISLYIMLDEGQILNVAVKKEFRNLGVGASLIEKAQKEVIKKRVKKLTLELRLSNEAAKKLYEKCGFQIDGVRKNFYEKPKEDALLMSKVISD